MTCSVPHCRRGAICRGWCKAHYSRWRKTGDVQADKPLAPRDTQDTCNGPGCSRWARTRGLCRPHYMQQWRGLELTPIQEKPQRRRYNKAADVVPEVEFLLATDTAEHIARRLGYVSPEGLGRALQRADRLDLARFFWKAA